MKHMLKTIEELKKNNEFLHQIDLQYDQVKSDQHTSYPYGIPNTDIKYQIMYNNMMVSLLEYWIEKVGDSEIRMGKYVRMYLRVLDTHISLEFCLDEDTSSELYDKVFGSSSTIYQWVDKHFPSVFGMAIGYFLDEDITIFNNLGTRICYTDKRHLAYFENEYTYDTTVGCQKIDKILNISKNSELMSDLDEVFNVYFEKLLKNSSEEDW